MSPAPGFALAIVVLAGAPTPRESAQAEGSQAAESDLREGRRLFHDYGCESCHGSEAQGSPRTGPRLGPDPWPLPEFIRMCREPRANMPPYGPAIVKDDELAAIWAFVASRPRPPESIPLLEDPGPDPQSPQK